MSLDVGEELGTSAGGALGGGLVRTSLDLTSLILSLVWVSSLSGKTLLDDVSEGVDWVSSVASQVSVDDSGAVNQLLLGEVWEGLVLQEPVSLNVSGGGEGPTRSTLSLVLDGGNGSLGGPVEWGDVGFSGFLFLNGGIGFGVRDVSQILADELIGGDIHESGFSQDVLSLSGVLSLDVEEVVEEDGQLSLFKLNGLVSSVEGQLPLLESLNDVSGDSGVLLSEHGGLSGGEGQEGGDEGQSDSSND